jgi:hypothetical protein
VNDDTGLYNVLTQNDPAEVTLYSDAQGSSQSNPGTMTDGIIRFWTASTVTAVDISVLTATGHAYFLEDVTQSNHKIIVNPDATEYTLVLPYSAVSASVSVDTGFTIPSNMLIKDVWLRVVTLGTAARIDVGTSVDRNGFLVEGIADTTGYKVASEALVSNSVSGSPGTLLTILQTNAHVRSSGYVRANTTSGASIVYDNITATSLAGAGYIFLRFTRMPA